MKKVIVFGNNDVSQLAKFYIEKDTDYKFICFCVDDGFETSEETKSWSYVKDNFDRQE